MLRSPTAMPASSGCYDAARAAALAGVPVRTVYWWAQHGVVTPSVSPVQEKLWSYADLLALRMVTWLRRPKETAGQAAVPGSPMPQVRRALSLLADRGSDPWQASESPLFVDRTGEIFLRDGAVVTNLRGQPTALPTDALDLLAPFLSEEHEGPHLVRPRAHLRIVPGRVTGEPHVVDSRITTRSLAALAADGYTADQIARLYGLAPDVVLEGIDLERQLSNVAAAA